MITDAFVCGARRMDLAGGGVEWKTRFGDIDDTLTWRRVVPRGRRHVRARLLLAPGQWRRAASRRVSDDARVRMAELERQLRLRA